MTGSGSELRQRVIAGEKIDPALAGGDHRGPMADQQEPLTGAIQPLRQPRGHQLFGRRVQPFARFVEQQPGRRARISAGEGEPPALTAG